MVERKGLYIKHNFNNDFVDLFIRLKEKYGDKVLSIHGIGVKDLDMTTFPKRFYGKSSNVAMVSVDDNANVNEKTMTQYRHEKYKAMDKINSIYMMYKWVKKTFSKKDAEKCVEAVISGDIFVNDLTGFEMPYCYGFDLFKLADEGMTCYSAKHIGAPKHGHTFLQLVIQLTAYISNQIMGAIAYPSLFPILDWYYRKDYGENYADDLMNTENWNNPLYGIKQQFQSLIYSLNFSAFRAGGQTAFTNLSVLDRGFLKHLFEGYVMPDCTGVNIESTYKLSKAFFEYLTDIQSRENVFTFPVMTLAISLDQDNNYMDPEFVDWVAEASYGKSVGNIFQSLPDKFCSCCRLKNDFGAFASNSLGLGGLSIGSLRVSGLNMPRLALREKDNPNALVDSLDLIHKILYSHRQLIKDRIEHGVMPLYTTGWIDINKQFSTIGLIGCNEYVENCGLDILTEEGQNKLLQAYEQINDTASNWTKAEAKEHNVYNIEAIPGESLAVRLADIDRLLGFNIKDYKLYSNQYVPLIKGHNGKDKASVYDRCKIQGIYDKLTSGGSILHITHKEKEPLTKEQYKKLIVLAKDLGTSYFAINYAYSICENHHNLIGDHDECPICHSTKMSKYMRVVGFIVPVNSWNKVRKDYEYSRRVSYSKEEF